MGGRRSRQADQSPIVMEAISITESKGQDVGVPVRLEGVFCSFLDRTAKPAGVHAPCARLGTFGRWMRKLRERSGQRSFAQPPRAFTCQRQSGAPAAAPKREAARRDLRPA